MTRIIAGKFRGRRLTVPADRRVRPTADRVREAWLSIVGSAVPGAAVVDLFAGSGALGLEALSRGAESATFVELSAASVIALRANVAALDAAPRAAIVRQDVFRFLEHNRRIFDLAFADPPYDLGLATRLVARFRAEPFATVLGVEHRISEAIDGGDARVYGDTVVSFFEVP